MFRVNYDIADANDALDEILEAIKAAVRPAAQAGAQVFYDEVRVRVPVSQSVRTVKGKTYQPGALKGAIYQVYSADNSTPDRATYHVSWNARKAPHGHLVEYGHWTKSIGKYGPLQPHFVPAYPFVRPAYDAKKDEALQAAKAEMLARVAPAVEAA